jgi:predicted DNA-binding protein with PD1-like motif
VLRLGPGEDLLESLWKYARVTKIKAASIVSTVGSLQKTNIRYSNAQVGTVIEDYFEIVSLVGNIDLQYSKDSAYPSSMGTKSGSGHVHISLSDANGNTIGGHLLSGNIVYTTAEITLVELPNAVFTREMDEKPEGSGYYELRVHTIKP